MTRDEPPIITRRRGVLPGMPPTAHKQQEPDTPPPAREPSSAKPRTRAPREQVQAPPRRRSERTPTPLVERQQPGRPVTLRLPEPLHRRYRRLVRTLETDGVETDVTELVHALLRETPTTASDVRALVRRWRAVRDVDPDDAPDHPYLHAGNHTTTLRLDPGVRKQVRECLGELEDLGFRTSLNELIAGAMHFGPQTPEEARQLLQKHRT